ncbi:hypothetical protein B9Z55_026961 [Caenorhabditis nigoni]|uniref:Uncharacterized protein n=1 Tax=Caenorhabditis nigoni TaxID=1611254 RepID=A0A2G5SIK7_9PELO|nr:hypothetical protein B9Z55_026961 [Caenorhabditis nigoni]
MPAKLDETSGKDPKVRAGMIFYEFQSGEPIFKCYQNFCKRMGPDFMDYLEFEHWFQRFSYGNFNLNHDSSQDPRYRTITDIPLHIFEKICENLGDDYQKEYWFKFRHVSKSFRYIVDSWSVPKFDKIVISCYENLISMKFDESRVEYFKKSENSSENQFACSGIYRDLVIDDLMSVLASPEGYKLQKLIISEKIDNGFAQKLLDKSRNLAVHVVTVVLNCIVSSPVKNVLCLVKKINKINILSDKNEWNSQEFIDTLNEITALKNVETIEMRVSTGYDDANSILSSLKVPKMILKIYTVKVDNLLRLMKILLQSPHLRYCKLHVTCRGIITFEKGIKKFGAENDPRNPNIFKYRIADSEEFFEIGIRRNMTFIGGIDIKRKSNSA